MRREPAVNGKQNRPRGPASPHFPILTRNRRELIGLPTSIVHCESTTARMQQFPMPRYTKCHFTILGVLVLSSSVAQVLGGRSSWRAVIAFAGSAGALALPE